VEHGAWTWGPPAVSATRSRVGLTGSAPRRGRSPLEWARGVIDLRAPFTRAMRSSLRRGGRNRPLAAVAARAARAPERCSAPSPRDRGDPCRESCTDGTQTNDKLRALRWLNNDYYPSLSLSCRRRVTVCPDTNHDRGRWGALPFCARADDIGTWTPRLHLGDGKMAA
jgi:hypothetical protein